MRKITSIGILACVIFSAVEITPKHLNAAFSFSLSKKENGIDGTLEVLSVSHKSSKIRTLDKNKKEIEKYVIEGRDARLDRIEGRWPNGSLFLVTPDLSIGWGSYNGPYSQPFQVYQGHIRWAKIYLPKTLKTAWKAKKIDHGFAVEILEIRCRPDFDHTPDNAEEMKFERTFTRYNFDGKNWHQFARSKEGCWETGDTFPDRKDFP